LRGEVCLDAIQKSFQPVFPAFVEAGQGVAGLGGHPGEGAPVGIMGVLLTIVMTAFELFIQAVQAYVFTLLAAFSIGEALHPAH
jgi:F0F1-type ATP synthase membrane subunit a